MSAPAQTKTGLIRTLQVSLFVIVIATWEIGARAGVLDTFFFQQLSAFLFRVWTWIGTGRGTILGGRTIYQHISVTLEEMVASFVLGVVFGVAVGFLLGRSEFWSRVFNPYIQVLNALPRLVLAPMFVLLPSAMSWIVSSLHTSVGFALVGAVVGEYLAAARGLGWVIAQAQGNFDAAGVHAGMTILCIIVVIVELGVTWLERRLWAWKPSHQGGACLRRRNTNE